MGPVSDTKNASQLNQSPSAATKTGFLSARSDDPNAANPASWPRYNSAANAACFRYEKRAPAQPKPQCSYEDGLPLSPPPSEYPMTRECGQMRQAGPDTTARPSGMFQIQKKLSEYGPDTTARPSGMFQIQKKLVSATPVAASQLRVRSVCRVPPPQGNSAPPAGYLHTSALQPGIPDGWLRLPHPYSHSINGKTPSTASAISCATASSRLRGGLSITRLTAR